MRIVFAPDSFKGSASATAVATSLIAGWRRVRPHDDLIASPMADGGEGTLDAFLSGRPGSTRVPVRVTGPAGSRIEAAWVRLPDGTAVVELASTSGITLLERLAPETSTSLGFGEAIADAIAHGAPRLLLALGGSASTDGGAGLLAALGARITRASRVGTQPEAAGADDILDIDLDTLIPLPPEGAVILSDVTNPLLGPHGSAAVFGPQKGADAETVVRLEERLSRLALMPSFAGTDPMTPGAGAAGGAAYALLAWGATMQSGARAVAKATGLDRAMAGADLVITGEGRFDSQSRSGKVVGELLTMAAEVAERPTPRLALVAGSIEAATDGFRDTVSLTALAGGTESALTRTTHWLEEAGARLAMGIARS
ncbi:glycerate kinase [Herbiconiux sp. A18JL235]|uniref:Glycerate kinase n=1 Tax=Herbiconiux sp. A18JL235 TaxID=3152363 RepID=A0AB39BC26_9MICO